MRGYLYGIFFSFFLYCFVLNVVSYDMNDGLSVNELSIKSGEFDILCFKSEGNILNVNLTFVNNGAFNLYIRENMSNVSRHKFHNKSLFSMKNVSGFTDKKIELSLMVADTTEYQIIFENIGKETLELGVDIENSDTIFEKDSVGNFTLLFGIMLVVVLGIVLVFSMIYSHKNRVLLYYEKKDLNNTLEKVIDVYKNNPDKVLDIIGEMSDSVGKEAHKLTDVFVSITDKVSDRINKC